MNETRARFEEIWPVPEGIEWSDRHGQYMIKNGLGTLGLCLSYEAKLDVFTRCQETTDVYVSLVDELIESLTYAKNWVELSSEVAIIENLLLKANKTRSDKK